jgi:hypothetical protein
MLKIKESESSYANKICYDKRCDKLLVTVKNFSAYEFLKLRLKQIFSISGLDNNIVIKFHYDTNDKKNLSNSKLILNKLSGSYLNKE